MDLAAVTLAGLYRGALKEQPLAGAHAAAKVEAICLALRRASARDRPRGPQRHHPQGGRRPHANRVPPRKVFDVDRNRSLAKDKIFLELLDKAGPYRNVYTVYTLKKTQRARQKAAAVVRRALRADAVPEQQQELAMDYLRAHNCQRRAASSLARAPRPRLINRLL